MTDTRPIHRVTLLFVGDEPRFEDFSRSEQVVSVKVEPNIGEFDNESGDTTILDTLEQPS